MTIYDAIQQFLTASPYPLSVGARVWFTEGPQQKQTPIADYVVFYDITARPLHNHTGPARLQIRTFQFSAFSESQRRAAAIAREIRRLLDGYRGNMAGVDVRAALWTSGRGPSRDDAAQMYGASDDFEFSYFES